VDGSRGWEIIDEGGDIFEIVSEQDTCCLCKLSFVNSKEFAEHMHDYHTGSVYLEKLTPELEQEMGHKQYCVYSLEVDVLILNIKNTQK
jgi:hypothetical protein